MESNPRKFRFGLVFSVVALVAVNALVMTLVMKMGVLTGGEDLQVAHDFMKAIEIGNGLVPDQDDKTGYELAYEFLAPELREETDIRQFLSFFETRITDHGFLDSWYRRPQEGGVLNDRELSFVVNYRNLEGRMTAIGYTLRLRKDEHYEVAAYEASGPLIGLGSSQPR